MHEGCGCRMQANWSVHYLKSLNSRPLSTPLKSPTPVNPTQLSCPCQPPLTFNSEIFNGFPNTTSAPLLKKCSTSEGSTLPVTPKMAPV